MQPGEVNRVDLRMGELARVLGVEDSLDGAGPGPWHYGNVVGFTVDGAGRQSPILQLRASCPAITSYYFARPGDRVERAFHTFADN